MTKDGERRSDPRTEATRLALIEAAESLFARFGFDAVSMRQIGASIGAGNTRVVAYHFGTKEEFIEAIYRYRLPSMDERRRQLLNEADADGRGEDLPRLLRILCLPYFEQTDADGVHSYGRFLCEMVRVGKAPTPLLIDDPAPATTQVWKRIQAQLPVDGPMLGVRLQIMNAMMGDAFRLIDGAAGDGAGPMAGQRIFEDVLAMCLAAITAPAARPHDRG